jgi:hypothetical protein
MSLSSVLCPIKTRLDAKDPHEDLLNRRGWMFFLCV